MIAIINRIKKKHPYIDKTALELFEHYIKEYDREVKLIIEVELRKFVSFMKSNDSFIEDQRYFDEWLEEYMGGKSDEIKEIKNERKT